MGTGMLGACETRKLYHGILRVFYLVLVERRFMTPSALPTPQQMLLLSNKNIPVQERLIVALDTENVDEAQELVTTLGDTVCFYKLGLSLIFDEGYWEFFDRLIKSG